MNGTQALNRLKGRLKRYFSLAREQSLNSTHADVHIGAVIVVGNWVVSKGYNKNRSHPKQRKYNIENDRSRRGDGMCHHRLHAEIDALCRSGRADLTNAEIYVYREDRRSMLAACRPCPACHQALIDAGVKTMYYTSTEGFHRETKIALVPFQNASDSE